MAVVREVTRHVNNKSNKRPDNENSNVDLNFHQWNGCGSARIGSTLPSSIMHLTNSDEEGDNQSFGLDRSEERSEDEAPSACPLPPIPWRTAPRTQQRLVQMASIFGARALASSQPLGKPNADTSAAHTSDDESYEVTDDREPDTGRLKEKPELAHHLQNDSSILALAVGDQYIYAGTQDGEIVVWSLASFELVLRIQAHTRAVLCLFLSPDGQLLFSSAGDAIVNAWCPINLKRLYHVYSTYDVGDVFSVAYSKQFGTVYLGAQNTSIQWCSLQDSINRPRPNLDNHPDRRNHRFFDSVQHGGTSTPRPQPPQTGFTDGEVLEIDKAHMKHYAHFGYVYCMLMVRGVTRLVESDEDVLISGGGDGTIKLWKLFQDQNRGIEEIACLGEDDAESVLSMAVDGSFLYSSKLEGVIELWDLDTKQKLRVIRAHKGDVMTLQMGWGYLWSAGATGFARKYSTVQYGKYQSSTSFSQKYHCVNRWKAHEGRILASAVINYNGQQLYITGGNDNSVSIWNITGCTSETYGKSEVLPDNQMVKSLQEFVAFKTISSRPDHAEDCRRGATFLRTLFKKHGAYTEMLNTDNRQNPVVYAKFRGNPETSKQRKNILFYGHYDVVPADNKQGKWIVDPFQMKGINGYLYGRGVSDNKGPIMAALYGVMDLIHEQELESDITFLIEGEEESGSRGFKDAVRRHKDLIGEIDYIILANSYWLDDEVPCLTYGLRGMLHATVKVDSNHPDVHSGVDGSFMMDEPLFDLTAILAKLKGLHNRIQIPGFYDDILPVTEVEEARYNDITDVLIKRNPELGPPDTLKASLMARWREPNLTIHRYKVSGPDGSLVSSQASAAISLRLVPNQEVEDVITSLTKFLEASFSTLDTHNHLSIAIDNQADAWLGDPDNEIFQTLEEAIMDVWGPIGETRRSSVPGPKPKQLPKNSATPPTMSPSVKPTPTTSKTLTNGSDHTSFAATPLDPSLLESALDLSSPSDAVKGQKQRGRKPLYIREGGSIPSIRFLEKEFNAPAAHLPCGQASDSAHLDNERLRVSNLYKSREIFRKLFKELPRK
ncbi:putative di- and tripeptidase [Lachnellula occidentalis]|uniref:Putative di-and tripeptidase n=1 Tax=Lachnellula occidentalis TaxID=215460 RepID=A0A8H8S4M3_9HELO|nr:putative di- and tripeptidase [Lachnellula occidentalis]